MKKRIWILGGTGYIGLELVKYLSHTTNYQLHLLVHDHIPYQLLENHSLFTGSLEKFDWSWLEQYPPDIIFHLARLAGSNAVTRNFSALAGAKANERLIQYLLKMPSPPKIVYVSGSLVYGHQDQGVFADENAAWNPVSYARFYFKAEKPWLSAQFRGPLDIRFARPGWIAGKGSWLEAFYIKPYLNTGTIPLYGNGRQLMSLVHIKDCVSQIARLAEMGTGKQDLNVFAGPPVTQQEFAEMLADQLNVLVEAISVEKLRKLYGQTVTEALTSSIPMKTLYPDLISPSLAYPDARSIVKAISSFFEYKHGVFTVTPQKSLIQQ